MNDIQQFLILKDKEMKKTTSRVNKAMRETVDVEGLADKIFTKYFKFIEGKALSPGPHINLPPALKKNKQQSSSGGKAGAAANNNIEDAQEMQNELGSMMDPD